MSSLLIWWCLHDIKQAVSVGHLVLLLVDWGWGVPGHGRIIKVLGWGVPGHGRIIKVLGWGVPGQ